MKFMNKFYIQPHKCMRLLLLILFFLIAIKCLLELETCDETFCNRVGLRPSETLPPEIKFGSLFNKFSKKQMFQNVIQNYDVIICHNYCPFLQQQ